MVIECNLKNASSPGNMVLILHRLTRASPNQGAVHSLGLFYLSILALYKLFTCLLQLTLLLTFFFLTLVVFLLMYFYQNRPVLFLGRRSKR